MHDGAATITAAVVRLGGIRLGRDWGKEAREEIPLAARRKHGCKRQAYTPQWRH